MSESLIQSAPSEETVNENVNTTSSADVEADTQDTVDTDESLENSDSEQELIFGKYKDMDAAFSAFKELESMNGKLRRERKPEAPEEYNIDFGDDEDLKDYIADYNLSEDPLFQAMTPAFKEANITDEQAKILVKNQLLFNKQSMPNPKKEIEAIGADYEKMDREISTYLSRNVDEDTANAIKALAVDAQSFKAIHKLIAKPSSVPTKADNVATEKSAELYAKAQEMRNKENFLTNYDAQQQYRTLMEKAIALEEKGM